MKRDKNPDYLPVQNQGQRDIMDMSLRELQGLDPNAKIITQGSTLEFQAHTDMGYVRAKVTQRPLGQDREYSYTPPHTRETQSVFEQTVMERLNSGLTQQQVADATGISQSRVSQIKRKYSK